MVGVSTELPLIGGGVAGQGSADAVDASARSAGDDQTGGGGTRHDNKCVAARSRQPAARRARSMVDIRREVRKEIAAIKAATPKVLQDVIYRVMQLQFPWARIVH